MNLLGLILPWWAKYAAIALACIGLVGFGWIKGNSHGSQKLFDYQQKQASEATRIAKARTVVTERVLTKYLTTAGATQVVTNTIEKQVIHYENAKLDTCILSAAARELHDAAAANRLPDAAGATDDSTSGIETAALVKTSSENYATCHLIRDRLIGLQGWIDGQAKVK
jgi:hypothetical protein